MSQLAAAPLRQRLAQREPLIGTFVIELPTRACVEAHAAARYDFVVLDLEHSDVTFDRLSMLVACARAAGVASIVRLEAGGLSSMTRVLDMHPDGVMVPGVSSAAEARAAVRLARFAPVGQRGLAPLVRHETVVGRDYARLDDHVAVVLQVEGADAVANAAAIASVEGVDAAFVGPYDLSQALGVPGELTHPTVLDAGARVARAVLPHAALGAYVSGADGARPWRDVGASLFAHGTDGQLLLQACRSARASWGSPSEVLDDNPGGT